MRSGERLEQRQLELDVQGVAGTDPRWTGAHHVDLRALPPASPGGDARPSRPVFGQHVVRPAGRDHVSVVEQDRAPAQQRDRGEVVGHEQDRAPGALELLDAPVAAALEGGVAHRQHLVDRDHLGLEMRGDGEPEAGEHSGRVALDRRVEGGTDVGELDYVVEASERLAAAHPEDRRAEVDVLAPGHVEMEAGAELDQRGHPAPDRQPPRGGSGHTRHQLEQRGLAGPVRPDDAERLPRVQPERQVVDRGVPRLGYPRAPAAGNGLADVHALAATAVALRHVLELDQRRHMTSTKRSSTAATYRHATSEATSPPASSASRVRGAGQSPSIITVRMASMAAVKGFRS